MNLVHPANLAQSGHNLDFFFSPFFLASFETFFIFTVILYTLSVMKEKKHTFILRELADLVGLSIRTVRYYIQVGLIDRPEGGGRGAHYTKRHLEQLIEIRKWQQAGLSLKRIRELLKMDKTETLVPPPRPQEKGSIEIRSHVMIDRGIELTIDPARSNLTPEKVRQLVDSVVEAYEKTQPSKKQQPS